MSAWAQTKGSDTGGVLVAVFSALAITANIAFVWPQAIKLLRSRNLDGVSPGTWTISVVLFSVWSAFALATSYWSLLLANASCLAAALLIMAIGTKAGWPARWATLSIAGVLLAAGTSLVAPAALAAVMTVAGVALRVPQLITLLRSETVSGVSGTTWSLSAATAACWLIVSLSQGAAAVAIANVTALVATLVLLAVLVFRRYLRPR